MQILLLMSLISPLRASKQASKRTLSSVKKKLPKLEFEGPSPDVFDRQWTSIGKMIDSLEERPPIESMGADALQLTREGPAFRFQTLVGTMLSPQTKDEQTAAAFKNLASLVAPAELSATTLNDCRQDDIAEAIRMVSFYKTKALNLKEASRRCIAEYGGDIPEKIEDLLDFKGVGPKVGYLTFTIARNQTEGICVDTHVHRISNRLGWADTASAQANGPEKTRIQLQSWLGREYWPDINARMVAFGQTICSAKAPQCDKCAITDTCSHYRASDW